jgi:hypothetical protein
VHFTNKIYRSGNPFPPKGRDDEKADMSSYWMTVRKRANGGI